MEKQTTFNWLSTFDVFLGGTGAAVFLTSYILGFLVKSETILRIGPVVGLVLVLCGTFLLFLDLTGKPRFYRLFFNTSSWIARGSLFIVMFSFFTLIYSIGTLISVWEINSIPAIAIGGIASLFAVLVILYTGFLFGSSKRVPFWGASALPLVFFSSSVCAAVAVLLLINGVTQSSPEETIRPLISAEIVLVLVQVMVLGASIGIASYSGATSLESVRRLKNPSFIIGVVVLGLIMPLVLLSLYQLSFNSSILAILAGIFVLVGSFLLRQNILKVGVRLPLYAP